MQQNFRSALYFMTSEIRMAGYDPTGNAGAGITIALPGRMQLTYDIDGNESIAGSDETTGIGFSYAVGKDVFGDGIPDIINSDGNPDPIPLGKESGGAGGYKNIAENIQAVEFQYLDSTGAITAVINDIRSIQLTILARARRSDPKFINSMTYTTPSGTDTSGNPVAGQTWGPYNDNFRRRMATTTIRCRNLGI
jgi:type IV pilus assembly protein PilW